MRRTLALFALTSCVGLSGCDSRALEARHEAATLRDEPASVRHRLDAARDRVWRLTPAGLAVHDPRSADRIDLALPGWVVAGMKGCPPDLALGPNGEAVITSNVLPVLWRVDPETLAVSVHPLALDADHDKDVGFSALVYSPQHEAYFAVSEHHRTLWRIDASLTRAEKIALSGRFPGEACRIGVGARVVPLDTARTGGLCVHTPSQQWIVDLVPSERAAYLRRMPCVELPRAAASR